MVQGMIEDLGNVIEGMSEYINSSYGKHSCISASQSQAEQRSNFPKHSDDVEHTTQDNQCWERRTAAVHQESTPVFAGSEIYQWVSSAHPTPPVSIAPSIQVVAIKPSKPITTIVVNSIPRDDLSVSVPPFPSSLVMLSAQLSSTLSPTYYHSE